MISLSLPSSFRKTTILYLIIATLLSAALIAGCDISSSGNSEGTLNVRLTDAPATYEAVYIDIQAVELNVGTEQQEEWQTISPQAMRLDLLKLNNGADTLLGTAELETGTYNQLRFILGDNSEIIVDGQSKNLKVPSGQESGFKVNLDATVIKDSITTKIIDFDAARSISVTGNREYILNPVLKVYSPNETGTISGQLVPQGIPALVIAYIGNEVMATTYVEEDGTFILGSLDKNIYKVLIQPDSPQYADTTLFEREVFEGEDTNVGIIQLPEN